MSPSASTPPTPSSEHHLITLQPEDAARVVELENHVWFEIMPGLSPQEIVSQLDWSRTRAVERTGATPLGASPSDLPRLAGMYSAWGMAVSAPGVAGGVARVPMSGLTWVGVHQDERRRGVLRAMMRDHLHGVHERGVEPIATLHASEPGIYGRFGYGLASHHHSLSLGRGTELTAPEAVATAAAEVRTHQVPIDTDEASRVLHQVHLRAAEHTVGAITRGDDTSRTWWQDFPTVRRDKEPWQVIFAERDGEATGWALFRRNSKWSDAGSPEGEIFVADMGAVDAATLLALAKRLVDFDLTAKVKILGRPGDDPLLLWAGHPRGALADTGDSLWVRLVDLPAALTARGYCGAVDVTVEVRDEVCPWNQGTWRVRTGSDGAPEVQATDSSPDLSLDVRVLGAAYLGGITIAAMARAGHVVQHSAGAVSALSRAMRGDVEPVGAFGF